MFLLSNIVTEGNDYNTIVSVYIKKTLNPCAVFSHGFINHTKRNKHSSKYRTSPAGCKWLNKALRDKLSHETTIRLLCSPPTLWCPPRCLLLGRYSHTACRLESIWRTWRVSVGKAGKNRVCVFGRRFSRLLRVSRWFLKLTFPFLS